MNKFITIFVLGLFFSPVLVNASDLKTPESGIQISPNRFDFNGSGGESEEVVINLHNYDDFSHDIVVEIEDFYVTDKTMEPEFYVPEKDHARKVYDIIDWIEKPDDFILEGNTSKDVHFKIKIPESKPTGGYYGGVFFKTRAPDAVTTDEDGQVGAKIKVHYRVGTLLTFALQGDEPVKFEAELLEFFPAHKFFWGWGIGQTFSEEIGFFEKWGGPASLVTHVKNTGNLHHKLKGEIEVYKFGKLYQTLDMGEEFVYPDRIRIYNNQFDFRWWDFGIYTAKVNLDSEEHDIHLESGSGTFYIIPWKTLLAIIAIITAYIWKKRRDSKKRKEELRKAKNKK